MNGPFFHKDILVSAVMLWGKCIIKPETEREREGGREREGERGGGGER